MAPTASIAGATQISGRIVETGIHKLDKLGLYKSKSNIVCLGCAPIPPVHPNFTYAMARTNDAILYGGVAYYIVEYDDDEELKQIVSKAPSKSSKTYGKPFYKIDTGFFAPAVLIVNNVKTGRVFKAGEINAEALAKSLAL